MSRYVPVETTLGCFYGRDCIHLDQVAFEDRMNTLVLEGGIAGRLCTIRQAVDFVDYTLRFSGVLALRMIELELSDREGASCFDEVFDSEWVRALIEGGCGAHSQSLVIRGECSNSKSNSFGFTYGGAVPERSGAAL